MATKNNATNLSDTSVARTIQMSRNTSRGNSITSFPEDIGDNYLSLTFKPYVYRRPESIGLNSVDLDFENAMVSTGASNTILLPVPTNLQDQNEARLGRFDSGYIGSKLAAGFSGITNGQQSGKDTIKNMISEFNTGAGSETANNFKNDHWGKMAEDAAYLTKFAGSTVARSHSVGLGVVANPKASLFYEGHELKNHAFHWTFAPRSEAESNSLKNIINFIKYCQLPITGGSAEGGLFLRYPMMVEMRLCGLDQDYFYRFKDCMLRSFNVNYSGQNAVSILRGSNGGRPAVVNMEMNLMEMDIHYADEYTNTFGESLQNASRSGMSDEELADAMKPTNSDKPQGGG